MRRSSPTGPRARSCRCRVGQTGDAYHIYPLFASGGGSFFGATAEGDPGPDERDRRLRRVDRRRRDARRHRREGQRARSRRRSTTRTPSRCSSTRRRRSWSPARGRSPTSRRPAPLRHLPDPGVGEGKAPAGPFIGVNGFYLASKGQNKALAQEFATNFLTTGRGPDGPVRGRAAAAGADRVARRRQGHDPNIAKFQAAAEGGTILPGDPGDGPGLGAVRRRRGGHHQG